MHLVGNDATKINEGLQVGKGTYPQFKPGMTQYEVTQDITVGYSKALANSQYGASGFDLYLINGTYNNICIGKNRKVQMNIYAYLRNYKNIL